MSKKNDDNWKPFSTKLRESTIRALKKHVADQPNDKIYEVTDQVIKKGLRT